MAPRNLALPDLKSKGLIMVRQKQAREERGRACRGKINIHKLKLFWLEKV